MKVDLSEAVSIVHFGDVGRNFKEIMYRRKPTFEQIAAY